MSRASTGYYAALTKRAGELAQILREDGAGSTAPVVAIEIENPSVKKLVLTTSGASGHTVVMHKG